ncbi:SdiA-regulated domain-containing protein [Adhaeribacter terreus]|uniref:SdiA-regulated domain-containing protein n=1 Tax=Adhaeribacter terreus TaxID=529703 RepID=A0ABW0E838_9BACT
MLKYKLFTIYIFLQTALCGCKQDKSRADFATVDNAYQVTQLAKMNKTEVAESSGFAWADDAGTLWTHGDGGGTNTLYKVDLKGNLLEAKTIPNTINEDWEDITKDKSGNLYIGDFGNNNNKRRNLRIFKINFQDTSHVDTIQFRYEDQQEFPPQKKDRNFDSEAFFWHNGKLYLFSKDRGREELVKVYELPDQPGNYVAKKVDELQMNSMITGADVSPDGKHFALLGYGKIYLFELTGNKLFDGKKYCIPVGKSGQAEALVFENNKDLIFSNENGKIFRVKKK